MTPVSELAKLHEERQAVANLLGLLPGDRIPVGGTALQDRAHAMARRDWAVRVLDAWAKGGGSEVFGVRRHHVEGTLCTLAVYTRITRTHRGEWAQLLQREGDTEDAARHAAALAVFPTLPAAVLAELGECP